MKVEKMIPLLKEKDKVALDCFLEEYSELILKVIAYVLKGDYEIQYIEECYDDVVISILNKCDKYEYKASFKTWISTIAKNKALDYKRKLQKQYLIDEITEEHIKGKSAEDMYFDKHDTELIKNIVDKLNFEEKKLFIKKFVMNLSTEELCTEYETNTNVIYKRVSRLKEKLRDLIKKEYKGEFLYE